MAGAEPRRDLEIEQDLELQRRDWRRERWGWVGMAVILVAALLGLCGTGPLSTHVAGEKGGALWVEYELFGRWKAPEEMRVHLGPGQAQDGRAHVWLSRDFVDRHAIERVNPPPLAVAALGDRYEYVFHAPAPEVEIEVTFTIRPERWGIKRGTVGVPGGPAVHVQELVYP